MFGLEPHVLLLLGVCLLAACAFEFVNGFHDTANAVATVIYTNALRPWVAVVWSAFWNFIGVFSGGIGVAMGIVYLLPVESLVDANVYHGIAMVGALILAAIIWNIGTWYYGIPASSSHALIGSILGVGIAFSLLPESRGAMAASARSRRRPTNGSSSQTAAANQISRRGSSCHQSNFTSMMDQTSVAASRKARKERAARRPFMTSAPATIMPIPATM